MGRPLQHADQPTQGSRSRDRLILGERGEPLIITQNGEAKVVVYDIGSYEQMQGTLARLGFGLIATGPRFRSAAEVALYTWVQTLYADAPPRPVDFTCSLRRKCGGRRRRWRTSA